MCQTQFAVLPQRKAQIEDPGADSKIDGHAAAAALASLLERVARHTAASSVAEAGDNAPNLTAFDSAKVPKISIEDYAVRLISWLKFSPECFTMASVYIDRLIAAKVVHTVSFKNVHRLLLCSVLVAAKMHDDIYYSNKNYAKIGGIGCAELNALEALLLTGVCWRVHISTGEFNEAVEVLQVRSVLVPGLIPSQVSRLGEEEGGGGTGECPSREPTEATPTGGTGGPGSETLPGKSAVVKDDDAALDEKRQHRPKHSLHSAVC